MNNREKFKRAVIEAIHGLPYDEAIRNEVYSDFTWYKYDKEIFCSDLKRMIEDIIDNDGENIYDIMEDYYTKGFPITIGRVMQALNNKIKDCPLLFCNGEIATTEIDNVQWKLTKENGQECDDSDQSMLKD